MIYLDGGKLETWDVQSSKSLQSLRAFADSVSGIQVGSFNPFVLISNRQASILIAVWLRSCKAYQMESVLVRSDCCPILYVSFIIKYCIDNEGNML